MAATLMTGSLAFFISVISLIFLCFIQHTIVHISNRYQLLFSRLDQIENFTLRFEKTYIQDSTGEVKLIILPPDYETPSFNDSIVGGDHTVQEFEKIKLVRMPKCDREYDLIILVQSRISHFSQRMVIRNTWGHTTTSKLLASQMKWKTFFIVARSKYEQDSLLLNREFDEFQDIIIGDTYEDFYTLSLKLQMAFEWSILHCRYKYLLKSDDDVFVNINTLFMFLNQSDTPKEKLFAGNVQYRARVFRGGRYGVSFEEYAKPIYPRYCSGGGYVLSFDVVQRMYENFNKVPPMRIDDAYIGELALLSGVDTLHDSRFNMYVENCAYDDSLIVHHPVKSRTCMEEIHDGYQQSLLRNVTGVNKVSPATNMKA